MLQLQDYKISCRLTTARRRTAAALATTANRNFGCYPEAGTHSIGNIINGDVLGFCMKVLIDQQSKTVYLIYVISLFWFVQNHCQGRTRSAAGLEKNTDRADLLFLEIILQNVFCFF